MAVNKEPAYKGRLSTLEFQEKGNEEQRKLIKFANYILAMGKYAYLRGNIDTSTNFYNFILDMIQRSPNDWKLVENMILNKIERYITDTEDSKYSKECNDICKGALLYLSNIYESKRQVGYLQHNRVVELLKDMNHVEAITYQINYDVLVKPEERKHKYNKSREKNLDDYDDEKFANKYQAIRKKVKLNKIIYNETKKQLEEFDYE